MDRDALLRTLCVRFDALLDGDEGDDVQPGLTNTDAETAILVQIWDASVGLSRSLRSSLKPTWGAARDSSSADIEAARASSREAIRQSEAVGWLQAAEAARFFENLCLALAQRPAQREYRGGVLSQWQEDVREHFRKPGDEGGERFREHVAWSDQCWELVQSSHFLGLRAWTRMIGDLFVSLRSSRSDSPWNTAIGRRH